MTAPAPYLVPSSSSLSYYVPTLTATVTAASINLNVPTYVGQDLQGQATFSLGNAPPAPVSVTISTGGSNAVLLSASPTTVGSTSLTFSNITSASSQTFYVQGITPGTTTALTVSVGGDNPAYAPSTTTVQIVPTGFLMYDGVYNGALSTTTLAANTPITLYSWALNPSTLQPLPNSSFNYNQPARPGVTVSVPVASSDSTTGVITTSPVVFNANASSASTAFQPRGSGTTVLSVAPPPPYLAVSTSSLNFYAASLPVTVTAANIALNVPTYVGQDLQGQATFSLGNAPPGPVSVTISAGGSNAVLLSASPTTVGSSSLTVNNISSTANQTFYVQGVTPGTTPTTLTATVTS
jgi:hypothetical protein